MTSALNETNIGITHGTQTLANAQQVLKSSTIAGSHYNTEHSSSTLPKLRLNNFDGNPLEGPEWSSMFIATVDKRMIPESEKMSHLTKRNLQSREGAILDSFIELPGTFQEENLEDRM